MRLRIMRVVLVVTVCLILFSCDVWAQCVVTPPTGMLPDGATYLIEVPSNWNGILFPPAETISAVNTLLERLETGKCPNLDASTLNEAASDLGTNFNIFLGPKGIVPTSPAFVDFKLSRYLRPFNREAEECESGDRCRDR